MLPGCGDIDSARGQRDANHDGCTERVHGAGAPPPAALHQARVAGVNGASPLRGNGTARGTLATPRNFIPRFFSNEGK